MEKIKIMVMVLCCLCGTGCKDYFIDEGVPNPVFDGNMLEFLENDPDNWSLTVELIGRAGLQSLFRGEDPDCPEITFFAPTNLSIYQFLFKTTGSEGKRLYATVGDIPEEECRELVLAYVVAGSRQKEDFDYEVKGTLEGGTVVRTLSDLELRVYRTKTAVNGIPDIGPEGMGIHFLSSGHLATVVSAGHVTNTGMVHALSSTFQLVNPKD